MPQPTCPPVARVRLPRQVDERLNGDGTGLPFGVNEGVLGWCMFGAFSLVWTIWFTSQKDLGDFENPEDGLKLVRHTAGTRAAVGGVGQRHWAAHAHVGSRQP